MADALGLRFGTVFPAASGGNMAFTAATISSSTSKAEVAFDIDEGQVISRLWYRPNAITGVAPVLKIGLQGRDSSGNPDGTFLGGGSPASKAFDPVALGHAAGTGYWIDLDNTYTGPNGGMRAAWVVEYESGTVGVGDSIAVTISAATGETRRFPFAISNASGVRTRQAGRPIYGYGSPSVAYGSPLKGVTSQTFNLNSTPDEYALAFQVPASYGDTFKVGSFAFEGIFVTGHTMQVQLYNGTTPLITRDLDTDDAGSASLGLFIQRFFGTLPTLSCGSIYRLGFAPQDTTNQTLRIINQDAAADWVPYQGGANCWLSTRSDSGAWTDDLTKRPVVEAIITDLTKPTGAGGRKYIIGG